MAAEESSWRQTPSPWIRSEISGYSDDCIESAEMFVNGKSEALLQEAGPRAVSLFAASCRRHFGDDVWHLESGKLWRKCIKSATKKKRSAVSRAEESEMIFADELIKVAHRFGIDEVACIGPPPDGGQEESKEDNIAPLDDVAQNVEQIEENNIAPLDDIAENVEQNEENNRAPLDNIAQNVEQDEENNRAPLDDIAQNVEQIEENNRAPLDGIAEKSEDSVMALLPVDKDEDVTNLLEPLTPLTPLEKKALRQVPSLSFEEDDDDDDLNGKLSFSRSSSSSELVYDDIHKVSESSVSVGEDTVDALQAQVRLMRKHLRHQAELNQARELEIRKLRLQNYARCRDTAHNEALRIQTAWRVAHSSKNFLALRYAQIHSAKYRRGLLRRRAYLTLHKIRCDIALSKILYIFRRILSRLKAVRVLQQCARTAIATRVDRYKRRTRRAWALDEALITTEKEAHTKCPLSGKKLNKDPLLCLADGHAYEPKALRAYVDEHGTAPSSTTLICTAADLVSRSKLRGIMNNFEHMQKVAIEACEYACAHFNFSHLQPLFACAGPDTINHFFIILIELLKSEKEEQENINASTAMIQSNLPELIIHHLHQGPRVLGLYASQLLALLAEAHPDQVLANDPGPTLMKALVASNNQSTKIEISKSLGLLAQHSNSIYQIICNTHLAPNDRRLFRDFVQVTENRAHDDDHLTPLNNNNNTNNDTHTEPLNADDGVSAPTKKSNSAPRTKSNKRRHRRTPPHHHISP